ncbi:PTS sugar transporter subunit IIA [Candidatus Cryosericum odellii]|jgi:PTS system galactitol-specific IIA component|uniref:PTS sugar transporter subunit IIA n=1 Tax=Candidatus Cryosericum odellii TaxID=2290917 RepID=A0A398DAT5_9BACT|nr:PTS sugar transporter subunit IIA [Candidatus Cryosericum odellii]RIE08381.1 PTS sugar transporter subunit IIA [Candidatus Cryosericum odellii]
MANILINKQLMAVKLDLRTKEEVLSALSDKLCTLDLVTEDFQKHLLEREESFPTGLLASIPLALCHTEAQYVKRGAMCAASLLHPVEFHEMGNPDGIVKVEIVFLLALNDPKEQVSWLKKMASIFKDETALKAIKDAPSAEVLAAFLSSVLS